MHLKQALNQFHFVPYQTNKVNAILIDNPQAALKDKNFHYKLSMLVLAGKTLKS